MFTDQVTKLSLPRFGQIMGINPLHLMGVQLESIQSQYCGNTFFQYEWQTSDAVSREEIARAIAEAEAELERYTRYRLMPSWEVGERHMTPRPRVKEQVYFRGYGTQGFPLAVESQWKWVIGPGRREATVIENASVVAYANSGIEPTAWENIATMGVNVPDGTLECEVAVYMEGHGGDERYRVRPVNVSIVGNAATITARRELFVRPEVQEGMVTGANYNRPVNGLDDAAFADEVDIWRVRNVNDRNADLIWFPPNYGCFNCGGGGCFSCAEGHRTGCLSVRDQKMGFIGYVPADWNDENFSWSGASWLFGRQPDAVELHYYGGWRDQSVACPTIQMAPEWERTVAILATARLTRQLCACSTAKAFGDYYQRNAAFRPGDGSAYDIELLDLGNPIGTRLGELYAWKRLQGDPFRVAPSA